MLEDPEQVRTGRFSGLFFLLFINFFIFYFSGFFGDVFFYGCWANIGAMTKLLKLTDRFAKMAEEAPRVVRDSHTKIILGVDRLDYTKGLVHRLKAFEILLQKYPEYVEQVRINSTSGPSLRDSFRGSRKWLWIFIN